jgi:hypothetical protein
MMNYSGGQNRHSGGSCIVPFAGPPIRLFAHSNKICPIY